MSVKSSLAALLKVKSIITLALTAVFCGLALRGDVDGEQFLTIFTTIIAFYYGTQFQKRESETLKKEEE
jgi:hypothetical protein